MNFITFRDIVADDTQKTTVYTIVFQSFDYKFIISIIDKELRRSETNNPLSSCCAKFNTFCQHNRLCVFYMAAVIGRFETSISTTLLFLSCLNVKSERFPPSAFAQQWTAFFRDSLFAHLRSTSPQQETGIQIR